MSASPLIMLSTLAVSALVLLGDRAGAATHHVPADYATINNALDACAFGDTVLVAPGTYTDYEIRGSGFPRTSCAYMVDGVVLRSEAGPDVTIIDMQGAPVPQPSVVNLEELPSEETSVEGFTVTGAPVPGIGAWVIGTGKATFRNCIFRDMDAGGSGGAGIGANGDIDVIDCEFVNCLGHTGGGIYHSNGRIVLTGTTFRECETGAKLEGVSGGPDESALIEDCVFLDNWTDGNGAGLFITSYNLGVEVRRCWFEGNVAGNHGGAIAWGGWETKLIEDCVFVNNGTTGVDGQGGAISTGIAATVRRCTFVGSYQNGSPFGGATLVSLFGTVQFENNVVVGSADGTALAGTIQSSCNVYWDNPDGLGVPLGATDRIVDPEFCDPENGDLTVRENSPCVEPGSLGCGQIGAYGIGCGVVSVESESWGRIKALHRSGGAPTE